MKTLITQRKKTIGVFFLLIFLFALPIICAQFLYKYGRGYLLKHNTHHGMLLDPPLNFQQLMIDNENGKMQFTKPIQGKWLLVYISLESYGQKSCISNLVFMKQLRLALGKEGARLINLYLTLPKSIPSMERENLKKQFGVYHGKISLSTLKSMPYASTSGFYIVDPHGNLIMAYSKNEDKDHILKDLKRLLKASRIG